MYIVTFVIALWPSRLWMVQGQDYQKSPSVSSVCGRHGDHMVSPLDSEASTWGLSPGQGHFVVFLGKTLYSRCSSLHPGV